MGDLTRIAGRALLVASLAWLIGAAAQAQTRERRSAAAQRTDVAPVIDGRLDDQAWYAATPIGEFVQVEPVEGAPPTERTEVRILYDADYLYLGLRFFDSEPQLIITRERERDAFLDGDDRVEIVIDTFLDRRNAYFFQMAAAGSRGDALIANNGQNFNKPWDGIWSGKTSIDALGWTAEIALPFKTLNFDAGLATWGLNIERYLGRRRESSRWASPRQDSGVFQVFDAGDLVGLEGLRQGVGLDVVPFFVGTLENDRFNDPDSHLFGELGVDAFYKLTSNLTASLTVNTDFAETEVDERQINLTRFPLFFPERRDFFLQDSGVFAFADLEDDLIPFFSRTIGLADGVEVPIEVGGKLTGRAGDYNIGVLDVVTDSAPGVESDNLFVARVSKNVGEQSNIGAIFTSGNPGEAADNTLFGVDANYRTSSLLEDKNFEAHAWYLASDTEGLGGAEESFGASLKYPNDIWEVGAGAKEIGADFDPGLGFVPRSGIREYSGFARWMPRIGGDVRQLEFSLQTEVVTDTSGRLETVESGLQPLGIEWESGDALRVEIEQTHDELDTDFEISDGVTVAADEYDFARYRLEFESSAKRPLAVELDFSVGDFFDGERESYRAGLSWQPAALIKTAIEFTQNEVSLPGGEFSTQLAGARFNFAFSPDLSWNNFLQWDSVSDSFGLNTRLRWIPVPGQEVFLVFNETLLDEEDSLVPTFQELAFKLSYTLRF